MDLRIHYLRIRIVSHVDYVGKLDWIIDFTFLSVMAVRRRHLRPANDPRSLGHFVLFLLSTQQLEAPSERQKRADSLHPSSNITPCQRPPVERCEGAPLGL